MDPMSQSVRSPKALRRLFYTVCGLSGLLLASPVSGKSAKINPAKWELIESRQDFKSFQQYDEKTGLLALKFVGELPNRFDEVVSVVYDNHEHRCNWTEYCKSIEVLERPAPGVIIEQLTLNEIMGMIDGRVFVSRFKMTVDPSGNKVSGSGYFVQHSKAHVPDNLVLGRVLFAESSVTKQPAGNAKVAMEILIDPEGWIPTWMVNMAAEPWPEKTFNALSKRLKQGNIPPSQLVKATALSH